MSRLSLRHKLAVVVASIVAAFSVATVTSLRFDREIQGQLSNIRDQYFPIIELGYRLDTEFAAISLGLRDAASAQDPAALEAVIVTKDKLIADLEQSRSFIDSKEIDKAKAAVETYFKIARQISGRMISSEAGTSIVDSMTEMQAKRADADMLLKSISRFDRERLSEAFTKVLVLEDTGGRTRLIINLVCLAFVTLISTMIWKDIAVKITAIAMGLERFGTGDFKQPIIVYGRDELSELGRQVNSMAERLQGLMKELEAFSYSVAHDLRAPLRSVQGFSTVLIEDYGATLSEDARGSLGRIANAAQRMGQMVDGLLSLSRLNRAALTKQTVDITQIAKRIVEELKGNDPHRSVDCEIEDNILVSADLKLMEVVLSNLLGNAWKFTAKAANAKIRFGYEFKDGRRVLYISDNGAGFDMRYADKLFGTFQRLHSVSEFEGHGIGLATVRGIIGRHGGKIWAESYPEKGATFYFTLE